MGNDDYEIVGVVADTLHQVGQPAVPAMYFPVLNGESDRALTLAVRTASDPLAFSVPIQKQIAPLDPTGVSTIGPILMTPDGATYVYGFHRTLGDLYLVEGLK